MTDDLIAKVRAALAAATPGPWTVEPGGDVYAEHVPMPLVRCFGSPGPSKANATLIAASPAWLAELCDEVETLRRTVSQVDDLYDCADAEKEYQLARAEAAEARVAELEAELAVAKEYDSGLEDGRDDAKAEVERLRAALRLIAALPAFPPRDIARRALGEGEP